MADSPKAWKGRYPVLAPEHHAELESRAAVAELADGLPPHQAEAKAHADYLRGHMTRAAAHHLAGIRAAHSAGDVEEAARHSLRYGVLARALGFPAQGEPPPDVAAMARDPEMTKVYGFRPHDADALLLNHLLGQRMAKAEDDEAPAHPDYKPVKSGDLHHSFRCGEKGCGYQVRWVKVNPDPDAADDVRCDEHVPRLQKAEGDGAPLTGVPVKDERTGRVSHDLSHVLPEMRRAAGERLVVLDGSTGRTAHHVREEGGRRLPLASFAEGEDGTVTPMAGQTPPADVQRAAELALRLRRASGVASAVDRLRHAAGAVDLARR